LTLRSSGKFPEFTEPSAGYHGLVYHEALVPLLLLKWELKVKRLRSCQVHLMLFRSFRIRNITHSCAETQWKWISIMEWLETQDQVAWVNYLWNRVNIWSEEYLPRTKWNCLFGLKGGFEAAKTVADETKIFSLLANIGDTKSLIIHPATHQQLSAAPELLKIWLDYLLESKILMTWKPIYKLCLKH
jgi:O-acetylhomoserine (thiol)-lyase